MHRRISLCVPATGALHLPPHPPTRPPILTPSFPTPLSPPPRFPAPPCVSSGGVFSIPAKDISLALPGPRASQADLAAVAAEVARMADPSLLQLAWEISESSALYTVEGELRGWACVCCLFVRGGRAARWGSKLRARRCTQWRVMVAGWVGTDL